jgi:hypothetical protein
MKDLSHRPVSDAVDDVGQWDVQLAYILAVNANIMTDSGGTCGVQDCTVSCPSSFTGETPKGVQRPSFSLSVIPLLSQGKPPEPSGDPLLYPREALLTVYGSLPTFPSS